VELIKRYIYAVTHKLPEAQRADIEQELQGLIEDMLDQRVHGGEYTAKDVEEVLMELGPPHGMAAGYRNSKRYLISPEIFDLYVTVLKTVLVSIVIALSVVFAIELIVTPGDIAALLGDYLVSLFTGITQVFTGVTIAFGIMEYSGVKSRRLTQKEWKPSRLQPIPHPNLKIKRSEPIVGIIFAVLFMVLITVALDFFGVRVMKDSQSTVSIPFFNPEVFKAYLPLFWILIAFNLLKEFLKLYTGKWTKGLFLTQILFNLLTFLFAWITFADPQIWNTGFMSEMVQYGLLSPGSESFETVGYIWRLSTERFLYFITVVLLIDTVITGWKVFSIKNSH